MKSESPFSRYTLLWVVIISYFVPLIGLTTYSTLIAPVSQSWNLLSIGLFTSLIGTLFLFWMMTRWEFHHVRVVSEVKEDLFTPTLPVSPPPETSSEDAEKLLAVMESLEETQQHNQEMTKALETLTNEVHRLEAEKEHEKQHAEAIHVELEDYRQSTYQQLYGQQTHIRELQEKIADQRNVYEKKQQQIGLLETKVSDLTYEIKTLLQLAEAHSKTFTSEPEPTPQRHASPTFQPEFMEEDITFINPEKMIHKPEEATQQLKRCLDIAQKITGSNRFGSHLHPFLNSPSDSFSIDLRRLCDSLRSENNCSILLYSPKENKLLFANNQIKALTGWSPDKFIQNFRELINDEAAWRQGVSSLAMRSEAQLKLAFKTKSGQDVFVQGHLGMIPTGIFRQHTIAVIY